MNTSTIKAIAEFDWDNQRVLCRTFDGMDRIEWLNMRDVYVNPQTSLDAG